MLNKNNLSYEELAFLFGFMFLAFLYLYFININVVFSVFNLILIVIFVHLSFSIYLKNSKNIAFIFSVAFSYPFVVSYVLYGFDYIYDACTLSAIVWIIMVGNFYDIFEHLPREFKRSSEIWMRVSPLYEYFYYKVLYELKDKPKTFSEVYYDVFINPEKETLKEKIAPTFWRRRKGLKKVLADLESWGLVRKIQDFEKPIYSITENGIIEVALFERLQKMEKKKYKLKNIVMGLAFIIWVLIGIHWIFL